MPPLPSSSASRYVPSTLPMRASGSSSDRSGSGGGLLPARGSRGGGVLLRPLGDSIFVLGESLVPTARDGCESRCASSISICNDCVGSRDPPPDSGRWGGRDRGSRVVIGPPRPHVSAGITPR